MGVPDTITLVVNGMRKSFPRDGYPKTVLQLVENLGFDKEKVVVEVNGMIVKQVMWKSHPLQDGDQVELVSFVGGG